MGFQRKIVQGKRTIKVPDQEAAEVGPQLVELRSLKLKRSRGDEGEDGDDRGGKQLSPTANGAGTERSMHCPPAPKKPRLLLGCSLDGFKVLRVMDLRGFLR